jgi:hypothetical protein
MKYLAYLITTLGILYFLLIVLFSNVLIVTAKHDDLAFRIILEGKVN